MSTCWLVHPQGHLQEQEYFQPQKVFEIRACKTDRFPSLKSNEPHFICAVWVLSPLNCRESPALFLLSFAWCLIWKVCSENACQVRPGKQGVTFCLQIPKELRCDFRCLEAHTVKTLASSGPIFRNFSGKEIDTSGHMQQLNGNANGGAEEYSGR